MQTPSTVHPRERASIQGFTLVESLIAVSLLAVLFLAVAQTSSRASDAFDEGGTEHTLSTGLHRALERIVRAIEFSDGSLIASATEDGNENVSFQTPASFEGGVVTWTPQRILAELEPGELNDGLDNDGDSLIDELRVVLVQDDGGANETRVVLVSGVAELAEGELANAVDDNGNGLVDESGLTFSADENVVTVRLTCQRQDEGRRLLTKTAETAVRLHNSGG
ncbi:MAG: prepilin-type N-terminal cleavage/methylation domain-containing protein [Planctomycetes bacterium]|nr:prepilin-type N-terminal cleavage/methylation domain-containing protein [Planctomycetota bacterium]